VLPPLRRDRLIRVVHAATATASPSEKGLVDDLARAWMGGVEIYPNLIRIQVAVVVVVVVAMRGVKAMMVIPILTVATSHPG
jgi:hypothetical protein